MDFLHKHLIFIFLLIGTLVSNSQEWKQHPSFDQNPLRIIDTPDYTYFLAHQQMYNKTKTGYNFPSIAIFQCNKNSQSREIHPLSNEVCLNSADIRIAEYSPAGEFLILIYADGNIDIIGKDRVVVNIDKLRKYQIPGMTNVNSVSFDPATGDAWLATDAGYMVIDANKFSINETKVLNFPISAICKFGNKRIVISSSIAYQTEIDNPRSLSDFKQISGISDVSVFMPLSENSFAYVTGEAGKSNSLKYAISKNDNWQSSNLKTVVFSYKNQNETTVNQFESNFIPNKSGYLCFSSSRAYQIKKSDLENGAEVVSISLDSNPLVLGSWDFNTFWTYRDRGTFIMRKASYDSSQNDATATWKDIDTPVRPNAPAAFLCSYMAFSKDYGHLVINHGQDYLLYDNAPASPVLTSGLKQDGKWNLYSQVYATPNSILNNNSLLSTYKTYINNFPLADPYGLIIDPENPDWICCSSMFGGVMFQNIADIRRDVVRFGSEKDRFSAFPGFMASMQTQTWGSMSCFSNPDYDPDGTYWLIFTNAFPASGSEVATQLKYMTSDVRKNFYATLATQVSELENWSTIEIPDVVCPSWDSKIIAGKHPKNKNKIFYFSAGVNNTMVIYDHKGTLSDSSDDDYTVVEYFQTDKGKKFRIERLIDAVEDPISGNIFIGALYGLFSFNPEDKVNDATIQCSINNENNKTILPVEAQINKVIFDAEGRMWIGTNNCGVICYGKDRKTIEAAYDTSNSPIPSNCVYGLGWNPKSQSLMISTKLGLAELFPNTVSSAETNASKIRVTPESVLPDYNGNVTISNLPNASQINIYGRDKILIKTLYTAGNTSLEWDLTNTAGQKVSSGVYTISLPDKTEVSINVM